MKGLGNITPASLEQLPAELLLNILCYLPNLSALHSLLLASAHISRVFLGAARHITDTVLLSSLPPQVHAVARAVVLLRVAAAVLPPRDLVQAIEVGRGDNEATTPPPLPTAAAPALLRRFVALAHEIHCTAHACLGSYLARCGVDLRPARLPDEVVIPRPENGLRVIPPPEVGVPYEVPPQEPPSWIEEQRVLVEVWMVQVFYEAQRAQFEGRLGGWTEAELASLDASSAVDFFFGSTGAHMFQREMMLTVLDFLASRRPSSEGDGQTPPAFRVSHQPCARGNEFEHRCAPEPLFGPEDRDLWLLGRRNLGFLPPAWHMYRNLQAGWRISYRCESFEPFRRFGFAIWNRERLTRLGFYPEQLHVVIFEPYRVFFTWFSILTDEEIVGTRRPDRDAEERPA